jgi:transposase
MKHQSGDDRHQAQLLPPCLDDYVGPEHPVRFLDAFVAGLDLAALGFAHATPAATGRPAYDPGDLLRLYLYGYLHRVRSSRRLEAECHRNLEVRWLLRQLAPDHKTIADFRKDHPQPLRAVGGRFRELCRQLDLFGAELVAIDGTKLAAVNSRERNYTAAKLAERIARAEAQMADYLAQLDATDTAEPTAPALTKAALQEKIARLRERQAEHRAVASALAASGEKQISLTDPDARRATTRHGTVVGYNAQAAVDAKHKLLAAEDVTTEVTDIHQLATMAVQAKENLHAATLTIVADTGYCDNAEVKQCVEAGLTPHVPKADTSANTAKGLYGKRAFRYDATADSYTCPAGATLPFRRQGEELGRTVRYYHDRAACAVCAMKTRCTENKEGRRITREASEHLMDAMAARLAAQPEIYRQRKALCEHPFGTLKRGWGYGHFLVKGLTKVRAEWSLMTLAYNLRRALNLVPLAKLLAAVAAQAAQPPPTPAPA